MNIRRCGKTAEKKQQSKFSSYLENFFSVLNNCLVLTTDSEIKAIHH
jgi:hypothetical protein